MEPELSSICSVVLWGVVLASAGMFPVGLMLGSKCSHCCEPCQFCDIANDAVLTLTVQGVTNKFTQQFADATNNSRLGHASGDFMNGTLICNARQLGNKCLFQSEARCWGIDTFLTGSVASVAVERADGGHLITVHAPNVTVARFFADTTIDCDDLRLEFSSADVTSSRYQLEPGFSVVVAQGCEEEIEPPATPKCCFWCSEYNSTGGGCPTEVDIEVSEIEHIIQVSNNFFEYASASWIDNGFRTAAAFNGVYTLSRRTQFGTGKYFYSGNVQLDRRTGINVELWPWQEAFAISNPNYLQSRIVWEVKVVLQIPATSDTSPMNFGGSVYTSEIQGPLECCPDQRFTDGPLAITQRLWPLSPPYSSTALLNSSFKVKVLGCGQ